MRSGYKYRRSVTSSRAADLLPCSPLPTRPCTNTSPCLEVGAAGLNKAAYDNTSTQEVKMPRREPFAPHSAGAARSTLLGLSFSDTLDLPCLAPSTLRCQTPVPEGFPPAPRLLTILNTFRAPHSGPDTFQMLSTCYLA